MAAPAVRLRRPRIHAPPPTPIRTARGSLSAAADDHVLTEYLESSLRVPDLTLPHSHFPAPHSPPALDVEVSLSSLAAREGAASRRIRAAAAESGAFRIGGAVPVEDVRAATEAGVAVFAVPEEKKRGLGRWFRRRDLTGEEFYWYRPTSPEVDRMLEAAMPDSYRNLREKMENVAEKIDSLVESVATILAESIENPKHPLVIKKTWSIVCLTQYNSNQLKADWSSEYGIADSPPSYAMSLHICGHDQDFCLRSPEGSTFFGLPAGSILVTVGKQLQEWSGGVFKSAIGEILFELTEDPHPFFSMEFFYSIEDSHPVVDPKPGDEHLKTLSIFDQLLIILIAVPLFHCLWLGSV